MFSVKPSQKYCLVNFRMESPTVLLQNEKQCAKMQAGQFPDSSLPDLTAAEVKARKAREKTKNQKIR